MARGTTTVVHPNRGADCQSTLAAVARLGATVVPEPDTVRIEGTGGRFRPVDGELDLGNSGTGLRLLAGAIAAQPFAVTLVGDASLSRRPMERVLAPLRRMGARAVAPQGDHPPIRVGGGDAPLTGTLIDLPVPSAQIKSAILLAGIQAAGRTEVRGAQGSRDHTERLLAAFGGEVETSPDRVAVTGGKPLCGTTVHVPGDPSAATFYLAALVVVGAGSVVMEGVGLNPTRCAQFDWFRRMGLEMEIAGSPGHAEPLGGVRARVGAQWSPVRLEGDAIPPLIDELPALAVAAAFLPGTSVIRGAAELRHKESNRLETVTEGLRAIGARVEPREDGWVIEGRRGPLPGGTVDPRGDHRIAMAFLVAGLGCEQGVRLADAGGIGTSDPFFLKNLERAYPTS